MVKAEIEKQDQFVAVINLAIPGDQVSQEYNKTCKRLGQRLNIPGFRRGKAPRGVVEKAVGIERIKQETMDRLLPPAFADVISEHQLDVVAPPQIETFKFDLGDGIEIKAQVELRPETKLPALDKIKVSVPCYETPADAEEKEMQALVERMTDLQTVIDRPAKATDLVNIDFAGTVNGETIKGGSAKNYRLDLGNNNFIEGFAEQIPDHKISEEFTIKVTFPKDYHDATLGGKEAEFLVKINEIKEKVVPELNDELAKKIGPYENVAELKEAIQKLLKENEENENLQRQQQAVIESLVGSAEVEIPDPMINREAKILMEEVKERFRSQGLPWEQFLDGQGHESIWENLRKEAFQRIKTSLVFGTLAKQEHITVGEEEFSAQVRALARSNNVDDKAVMRQLANNMDAAQSLNDQLLAQKIVEFLMARAEFTFTKEEVKAEDAPSPEGEAAAVASTMEGEEFEVLEAE